MKKNPVVKNRKLDINVIKERFEAHGFELLDTVYKGASHSYSYRCKEGHEWHVVACELKRGHKCPTCRLEERGKHPLSLKYEDVKRGFKDAGCQLLETEYKNCATLMRYICVCKREAVISWNQFSKGRRCRKCFDEKTRERMTGDKNWKWNPDLTDEERENYSKHYNETHAERCKVYRKQYYKDTAEQREMTRVFGRCKKLLQIKRRAVKIDAELQVDLPNIMPSLKKDSK